MAENPLSYKNYLRTPTPPPIANGKLLLHVCCVVCAGEIIHELRASQINFDLYFSNPNIHPQKEYTLRLQELQKFADLYNLTVIEDPYQPQKWHQQVGVYGSGQEGGKRCQECFRMRLKNTQQFARENNYSMIATTLGISRWKNLELINQIGTEICNNTAIHFWDKNWRKKGGGQRMYEIAKEYNMYQQTYCGCIYSVY